MTRIRMVGEVEASDFPNPEFRFFIYHPEGHGFLYFRSAAERDAAAPDVIRDYCDDGWAEEVEFVVAGEVTHTCQKTNVELRPDKLDEEGYDDNGVYWDQDWDCKCDYGLVALQASEQEQQP